MSIIIKDTLHPENESGTDIYPKTSTDQVVGYGQDANGKDYATGDDTCKKPINIGTPTHVLGVEGGSSNQPISILIGNDRNNIPKRNANGNIESLNDAINNNEYVRKGQFDRGLSEVSAPVVNITATSTATQGTISSSDLQVLQGNKSAIIRFNNELYYFMDDEYKSGYLTYSHVGVDAGAQWVKNITITISSLNWVLTKSQIGSSKLYKHKVTILASGDITQGYSLVFYNNKSTPYISTDTVSIDQVLSWGVKVCGSRRLAGNYYTLYYTEEILTSGSDKITFDHIFSRLIGKTYSPDGTVATNITSPSFNNDTVTEV